MIRRYKPISLPTGKIPIQEMRLGDHFCAKIPHLKDDGYEIRICRLIEIHEPILRVQTSTRKDLVPIKRSDITSLAWR